MKKSPLKRSRFKVKKRKTKKRKPTPRKKLMKECDILWSLIIRKRDYWCPRCKAEGRKKKSKNAHHIFSRRYVSTRHDLDNGIGLCIGHHMKAHDYPEEMRDFLISYKPDKYLEVKKLAQFGEKVSVDVLEEIKEYLQNKLEGA